MTVRVRFRREAEADVIDALAWYVSAVLNWEKSFSARSILVSPRYSAYPKAIRSSIAISGGRS
jgi:hypothetical protein